MCNTSLWHYHHTQNMSYCAFPSEMPDLALITADLEDTVQKHLQMLPSEVAKNCIDIWVTDPTLLETTTVATIPSSYHLYVDAFLYCCWVLVVVLFYTEELKVESYKSWVVLTQNYMVTNSLFQMCLKENNGKGMIRKESLSAVLEQYIVTEVLMKWHEPVYISQYDQQCTTKMPNISQASLEDIDECNSLRFRPHNPH